MDNNQLFVEYYKEWVSIYKEGAIRPITLSKYKMAISWLEKLVPNLKLCDLDRISYQKLINDYAKYHERQTTMDFHHQIKGSILDAVDEGLISKDPTRKAIIKGKTPSEKKPKYLNQFELHNLLTFLNLKDSINWDWFILLVAKTGIYFVGSDIELVDVGPVLFVDKNDVPAEDYSKLREMLKGVFLEKYYDYSAE